MTDQVATPNTELNLEDLDDVVGGIIVVCRKAGGALPGSAPAPNSIIAV